MLNGQQYRFTGWSNGVNTPSQSVVVSGTATITANFGAPALGIQMSHSGNFALGQNGAVYMVTVSNTASVIATSGTVTVTEVLPAGLSLAGMSGSGWSCSCRLQLPRNCSKGERFANRDFPAVEPSKRFGRRIGKREFLGLHHDFDSSPVA
jgi:uncharacterized repeat protein (TIGR01451 family)